MKPNELTHEIIGAAIEVHRELGPGNPEAAYERALAHELTLRNLAIRVQKPVPVVYKDVKLECGFRLDVLVCNTVVVEVKSVEGVLPVHRAQTLTYLKLGGWKLALLLNFNVAVLKDGIEVQPVHEARLLSQLRLGGWKLGLLMNFNTLALREGLRRIVMSRNTK